MLVITFVLGVIVGVAIIIGLLRMTATTDPTGCIVVFGSLLFLIIWMLLVIPWLFVAR
jgi:hypothetical protein